MTRSLIPLEQLKAQESVPPPVVKVFCNNDQVIIAWRYEAPIEDCIGFAIYRQAFNESEAEADALMNRVGFEDEEYQKGEQRPSTEWPVQRFVWTDFTVGHGDRIRYKVVPILYDGEKLIKNVKNASAWTDFIRVETGKNTDGQASPYSAYFNRGLIASQFFSRMKKELSKDTREATLTDVIKGPRNKLRDFLGGYADNRLFKLLDDVAKDQLLSVYAALYELDQEDVIEKLCAIGARAHIILANGAAKAKKEDRNAESRQRLKTAGVNVYDRIVDTTKKHFAHNKFIVVCENENPQAVLTGSTNLTPGGMYSQVNNMIIINNEGLAGIFYDEWTALKKDVEQDDNQYGPDLYDHNRSAFPFGDGDSRVWFTPTAGYSDLKDVQELMERASSGILFLMFNPGPQNTFFNYIQDLQEAKKKLFIHGVINQDPGGGTPLIFFHKGQKVETDWDAILPKAVNEAFSFWYKEISAGLVTIHSKVLVIDPFGERPYVVLGSHNFGPKASRFNDENLLIIQDRKLAEEYAVNVMAVYDHYRWRYSLFHKNTDFRGLTKDREWMQQYMSGTERMRELSFWISETAAEEASV